MNVSRRWLCMTVPAVTLALACTTGIVKREPDLAGVQVADGVPDAVPAEATPKPAPKPKPKPKPTVEPEPDLAGVQVADGVPDAVLAEPTPKPAPKPKPKPKPNPAQPATAPEPAKPEPALAAPEPPKPLSADEVVPILGKKVLGPAGEDLGRVVNVLVDQTGRTRAAVIDFGGFLGVGSRKIAVAWDQLTFRPGSGSDRTLVLGMTREQIQGAREYKERTTDQVDVATPPTPGQTPAAKPSN